MNPSFIDFLSESIKNVNDSIIDEFEVSKTASNRYEVEIKDKIRDFLDSQEDPRYSSLDVQHYEESDSKYHSDVYITNPKNGKQVWIEVKLNKYANLGGLSFKYRDGEWTCTTASEDNPLNRFYLDLLSTHGKKFIDFCKDYLGTEEIRLPTDMTDDLLDAWKASGSIEDTENETQFITEKIPLDGFGSVISRFYMTAKEEPVYYIQVADDLYIIDSECNPLDLHTREGNPLKSISDAYRIGRIQFRVKAMNVKGERYFSIVSDVKILSDKEHFDKEYSCSFDTPEKWPVVGNKTGVIKEKLDETKFLTNLPNDTVRDILHNTKVSNSRFNKEQFEKLFGGRDVNWCVLATKDANVAIAAILEDYPFNGYCYINEIQSLEKGYGKILIDEIVKKYKKVWLTADVSADEKLVDYYRQFDFEEIVIKKSVWDKEAHFFCTKDCDCDKLEVYIVENYTKKEDLKEADKDIGGDVWDKADDVEGTKIWIDDIREAPEGFKWFKTVNDFIDWCYQRQDLSDVALIDTDHDAGDYQEFGGDYVRIFDYLDRCGVKNVTVHIHSANPVGATNIRKIIGRNKENGWKEVRNSHNKG